MSDAPGTDHRSAARIAGPGDSSICRRLSTFMPVRKPKRQRGHVEQFRTDAAEHAELVARAREAGRRARRRPRVAGA